jgi:peptidyl-Asp metalloendopeptidase
MPQYRNLWSAQVNEEAIRQPAAAIRLNGPDMPEVVVPMQFWSPRAGYIQIFNKDDPDRPITIPDPDARPEDFSWHWYGRTGYVSVSLTVERGVLAGRVWLRGKRYALRPSPAGLLLGETNAGYWRTHPEPDMRQANLDTGFDELGLRLPLPPVPVGDTWDYSCSGSLPTEYDNIDVLFLYTTGVLDAYGSHAAVVSQIRAAIDDANNAIRNSRIETFLFHLRHAQLLPSSGDFDNNPVDDVLYSFSGIQPVATPPYCSIENSSSVLTLRDDLDADVVALARRDQRQIPECGFAFIQRREVLGCAHVAGEDFNRFAFLVFDPECNADRLNLAHELGHVLGADHDPRNISLSAGSTPSCPWSVGHRLADATFGFRTVMAYPTIGGSFPGPECESDSDCPQIDAFSNPALEWTGSVIQPIASPPQGAPIGVGDPPPGNWQQARVADTMQRLAPIVAAFQARTDLIHAHGFE